MADDIDYGKLNKRIVFTENDHRHVNFLMKLKTIGLTQSKFFRYVISGLIDDDPRLYEFIDDVSDVSKKKKKISKKLRTTGIDKINDYALNDSDVENIFDMIAEEFPTL